MRKYLQIQFITDINEIITLGGISRGSPQQVRVISSILPIYCGMPGHMVYTLSHLVAAMLLHPEDYQDIVHNI